MMILRLVQSKIIRIAKAELALAYRRRRNHGPILFAPSTRRPIVVGEGVPRTSGLYTRVIWRRLFALLQVGESNRSRRGNFRGGRRFRRLNSGLVEMGAVTLAPRRLASLVHGRKVSGRIRRNSISNSPQRASVSLTVSPLALLSAWRWGVPFVPRCRCSRPGRRTRASPLPRAWEQGWVRWARGNSAPR